MSENSFQSKGKNFVLKSDFLNNTNNSKRNSNNFDSSSINDKSQKNDEGEKNKNKNVINSNSMEKELDLNIINNNFGGNKNNRSHGNIIQDYYQKMENNIDLINNQFNNINLSRNDNEKENDINEIDKINNNFNNIIINEVNNNSNSNNANNIIIPNSISNENNNILSHPNPNINYNPNQNYLNLNQPIENQPYINQENINQYSNMINPYIINNQPQLNINPNPNPNPNLNLLYQNAQNKSFKSKNKFSSLNMNMQNDLMAEKRLEYLISNCVSVCKEQMECRLLQNILDEKPFLASRIIYQKIKDKIQEISFDQFGNYFIQKVIDYLNIEQISEILLKKISHNFRSFCFNQHGTRVIQKIFEKIINHENLLSYFNNLLNPNLKDFVIDQNASHIIIKYVNTLSSPKNDFIIKFLLENSYELAMKKYSCCVLQKCIE